MAVYSVKMFKEKNDKLWPQLSPAAIYSSRRVCEYRPGNMVGGRLVAEHTDGLSTDCSSGLTSPSNPNRLVESCGPCRD